MAAIYKCAALLFIATESVLVVLVSVTKDAEGLPYNTSSVVLIAECSKLILSLCALARDNKKHTISWRSMLWYSLPGALYCFNNNLYLYVLTQVPPAYFQLLLNTRVVMTALVMRFFTGKTLSNRQWVACFLLILGCSMLTLAPAAGDVADIDAMRAPSISAMSSYGVSLALLYCWVSVIAGLVCERLMKQENSICVANCQLYAFGVVWNLMGLLYQGQSFDGGLWRGWDIPSTYIICAFQVCVGLLVSVVLKHYDSIVKIFCVSCSNLVVYCVGVMTNVNPLSAQFIFAFIIVGASARILMITSDHNSYKKKLPPPPMELSANQDAELGGDAAVSARTAITIPVETKDIA